MSEPLPIDHIPHRPPMQWIRSAVRTGDDQAKCEAVLSADCGEEGKAPVLLGIEILAQAGAVFLTSLSPDPLPEGRLLRVREATWTTEFLPLETPLKAEVRILETHSRGLHRFSGRISDSSGTALLEADFSLLTGGSLS